MLGKSVSAFRQLLFKHTQVRVVRKIVGTLKENYNMWKENWTVQSETFIRSLKNYLKKLENLLFTGSLPKWLLMPRLNQVETGSQELHPLEFRVFNICHFLLLSQAVSRELDASGAAGTHGMLVSRLTVLPPEPH